MPHKILNELESLQWGDRLVKLQGFSDKNIAFSTSFSLEDQAITHIIAENNLPIRIFTIDTGRMFEETYKTFQKTIDKYSNLDIKLFYPKASLVEKLLTKQSINAFYDSVEKRHNCCNIRKVEPLSRALNNVDIWISGLRREHSQGRNNLAISDFDASRNIVKFYPLIDLSIENIKVYIKENNIPYNKLHDEGYPSIGCEPCTRAVKSGEDSRSGRWWWENENTQECGLHLENGKLVRKNSAE